MGKMSIREFNRNISEALTQIEHGEDIILTRHGKEIARLTREGLPESVEIEKERQESIAFLKKMREKGFDLGGPATYEERTGLDRLLR